jgi:isoquinoline 1-oxidoreductase alpha subunit
MIQLTVNGKISHFDGDPDMPLLWYLRDELALTGTKFGCGLGLCGACTVHLSAAGDHPLQKAWEHCNVPQCGYCQSGQIMQAAAMLKAKPHPTDQDIDSNMQGNICRCGTYQRIRQAIKLAAGVQA